MPNHQASEQMLGYLYQVRYALALLLENDNSDFQISIEKFDDVAFSKDGMPKQLIQLKHHIQRQGSLTDGRDVYKRQVRTTSQLLKWYRSFWLIDNNSDLIQVEPVRIVTMF